MNYFPQVRCENQHVMHFLALPVETSNECHHSIRYVMYFTPLDCQQWKTDPALMLLIMLRQHFDVAADQCRVYSSIFLIVT